MARRDIIAFRGDHEKRAFPVVANSTFEDGDVVVLDGNGYLDEAGDDPAAVLGICADPPVNDLYGAGAAGVAASAPEGTMLGAWIPGNNRQFRSDNFATDGAGTAAVPTQLNAVGHLAGLTLSGGGSWIVDTGTANLVVAIDDVLDSNNLPINQPDLLTGAGQTVVFHFI